MQTNTVVMKNIIVLVVLIVVIATACTMDKGMLTPKPTISCDTITFSTHVSAIINTKCATTGCHVPAGSGNGDFTSYAGVNAKVTSGAFENRVFVTQDMPPGASPDLTTQELAVLRCWLDAGAPNN